MKTLETVELDLDRKRIWRFDIRAYGQLHENLETDDALAEVKDLIEDAYKFEKGESNGDAFPTRRAFTIGRALIHAGIISDARDDKVPPTPDGLIAGLGVIEFFDMVRQILPAYLNATMARPNGQPKGLETETAST